MKSSPTNWQVPWLDALQYLLFLLAMLVVIVGLIKGNI